MDRQRLTLLIDRFCKKELTSQEAEELKTLIAVSEEDHVLELLGALSEEASAQKNGIEPHFLQHSVQNILSVDKTLPEENTTGRPHQTRFARLRWISAAAAIFLLAAGTYWWSQKGTSTKREAIAGTEEIAPGRPGAILTLSDGSQITLDSLADGIVSVQNGSKVLLQNGFLAYDAKAAGSAAYNTVSTPKGHQFHMQLPDGSVAWLNAASSITYPTAFTGAERLVKVSGEVYFEVVKDKAKPFRVQVAQSSNIEVLGTSFNINSYTDEEHISTTLFNGAIRCINGADRILLKPGEQAQMMDNASIKVIKDVNTEQVLAWKNGLFNFKGAGLQEVMRQLERWYNIEVVYQGKISRTYRFAGELERDLQLSQVLRILERMDVQFKLEGRKLIVMQQ